MTDQDPVPMLRALTFASAKHRDQRRKGVDASRYINHPIGVASVLAVEAGVTDRPSMPGRPFVHASARNASVGSMPSERRAGPNAAASATRPMAIANAGMSKAPW